TGKVTRFVPARVVGALGYALLPVGIGAVAAGRLGTAVLLVLLPPACVLAGRVFTAPPRRARRAAWAGGLLTAVVAAFVPPFWVTAGLALTAVVALAASGRRALVTAGWAVGVIGLIAAAAVSRVAVSQAGSTAVVRAWPGPALVVAGAGLLLAVVAAGDQIS